MEMSGEQQEMIFPAVKIIYKKEVKYKIGFEVPINAWPILVELVQKMKDKRGGFAKVTIDLPSKPRTTGEKSQGHHINGHIAQIANQTGNDFDSVKLYCKREAISRGYPFDTINHVMIPWSETRIDTIQAVFLIDTIHQLAAEMDIILTEE
jgi:hypothetical protein